MTKEAEPVPDPAAEASAVDFALMARIGAGDHEAFRQSEDIAQHVFLRIWRHAKRYRPEAKFTTYLYTITRNLVFNESRRKSRKKEVSADEREENSHQHISANPDRQPDSEVLHAELQTAVDEAIAQLPETQRMAVVLRRYEQLSYEEIAEVLEVSVSAVKSLLFRARTQLRETLTRYLDE